MENWGKINLEDVCLIKKGEQLNKLDLESAGDYPCINGGISPSGYTEKWNTKANTITISEGGNSCGFVNMLRTDFWSGGHCYSLLDIKDKVDNEFLYYALKGRESLIMDLRVGSGLPNIQQKAIKKFEFVYPKDKTEQTTIAIILSKTDQAIANTEALIAKYTRIKTGLMQDLLTKGIDENGNIRAEQTHEFKDSPLGRIPKEWVVTNVGSLCLENVVGIVIKPTQYYIEFGVPMLRSFNVREGIIKMNDLVYMSKLDNEKLSKSKLIEDDVVSVRTGYPGTSAIVTKEIEGCNCIDLVISRVKKEVLNPNFLVLWINSELSKAQILNHQNGMAQQHFNVGQMKELLIFKIDLKEQNRILEYIRKVDETLEMFQFELSKLQSLKTGLMQDLLSGKVRVNNLMKEKQN